MNFIGVLFWQVYSGDGTHFELKGINLVLIKVEIPLSLTCG